GAHVERLKTRQRRQRQAAAEMAAEEREKLADVALVSVDRLRRHPPFGREIRQPAREFAGDLVGGKSESGGGCCAWHDRIYLTPFLHSFLRGSNPPTAHGQTCRRCSRPGRPRPGVFLSGAGRA